MATDGCVVMQAQDHKVGLRHQFLLGLRVLAPLGRDAQNLKLRQRLQALPYLQSGGACFAVNEYLAHAAAPCQFWFRVLPI
jgi:hypothetical protein